MIGWKLGIPPGKYYAGMVDDYEVYFSPGGIKWHRKRTPEEKAAHMNAMKRIGEVNAEFFANFSVPSPDGKQVQDR